MNTTLSRRALLRTLGLTGAATILPWLRPRRAEAATIPTRLLLFWAGSGVPRQTYTFTSAGGGAPAETDFVFPAVRSSLNAIKDDLIVFENLDMVSSTVDPTSASNAHYAGETHSLAAANRANGDTPGGPSIDQYIASAINSSGPVTKIPSLSLMAQTDGNVSATKVCTRASGQVIAFEPSAGAAYQRLFSGFTAPPPMSTGPSPQQIAQLQQKSILDLVLKDFSAQGAGLSSAAKTKLDAHASAVRDFEKRLSITVGTGTSGAAAFCKDPGAASVAGARNAYPGDSTLYQKDFDAMSHLVQMAFACDLTRVVLLGVAEPFGDMWGYTSGNWGTTDAHDLIHKTSYNNAGTLKSNTDAMNAVMGLHQTECDQFKAMIDLLRQVPESDGTTMLDHTIVLWCSQIGEHGHDLDYLPWMIAGGSQAGFKPGRYLKYPRTNGKGAPHNNLFVSLAQAMGVQTNTFGNPSVCTGPLDRLRV
jgi:hypothetical protein